MPTRIDIKSKDTPVGATLMKTGQTISYATGDDGDIQAGRATDFFTLANPNPFGSTSRFTDELGGSTYANDIVIDWSTYDNVAGTVLGLYRAEINGGTTMAWNDAVDAALATSVGTFTTGWRLWNRNEAVNFSNSNGFSYNYSPLNSGATNFSYWTSTRYFGASTLAYLANNITNINAVAKTSTALSIAVRTFTVTGTTLS